VPPTRRPRAHHRVCDLVFFDVQGKSERVQEAEQFSAGASSVAADGIIRLRDSLLGARWTNQTCSQCLLFCSSFHAIVYSRCFARILHGGGRLRGCMCTFSQKKVDDLCCRRRHNLCFLSSGVHIFAIFEAH